MSKLFRSIGMSAAFAVAGILTGEAAAMPLGGSGKAALERIDLIAPAQYSYGGKDYCWYDDGWNGPGWYVCGQYTVRGVGWGGGAGWHGWVHTGGTTRRGAVTTGRGGGGQVSGRSGGSRTGSGRTGGTRTGSGGTGGTRTGSSRTGGSRTGSSRTGGSRTGGGRSGGGRSGGGRGGGRHSDVLLKHDIALLGRLENGLGFYRFSYNGSDKTYVGVMAQEVQAVKPEAVMRGSDGYLRVRYGALAVKFQTYQRWLASGAVVPSGLPLR